MDDMKITENVAISKEDLAVLIEHIRVEYGGEYSQIDKWYKMEGDMWIRRISDRMYYITQVFPLLEESFLCYLHVLDISAFDERRAKEYRVNALPASNALPYDIRYMYPIGISQDIEKAVESFIAPNAETKNEWLNKMGIK